MENKWLGPPHGEIPRCLAKTRSGGECGQYAMKNGRCRFHGGKSTGAKSPHQPLKHGFYTKEAMSQRKLLRNLILSSVDGIDEINEFL